MNATRSASATCMNDRVGSCVGRGVALHALAVLWLCVGAAVGCAGKQDPTADDAVAYFGLSGEKTYDNGGQSEVHTVTASNVLLSDGLTRDARATANGFVKQERTLTWGVTADHSVVLRQLDCVSLCASPTSPVPFLDWPIKDGASNSTTVDVESSQNGTVTSTTSQTHTIAASAEPNIDVPAGTFEGFVVSWTVTTDAGSTTQLLSFVEGKGIVRWQADGADLKLE